MRFIIWERSVQKKTDFWIVLCCILKEPKINMLEFSCWCKKNSQSIHEELHSIPLIFLNKKSEIWNDFTIFEKWKVKNFLPSLFSRSESENQMTQNRDREVKVKIKWLKIEIEKWIFKKNLENSRESRLSLVTVSKNPKCALQMSDEMQNCCRDHHWTISLLRCHYRCLRHTSSLQKTNIPLFLA